MRVSLVSDLHLEYAPIDLPGGEILLLAGDITVADYLRPERTDKSAALLQNRTHQFFNMVSERYNNAYYIMGNHEHYHGAYLNTAKILRDFISTFDNITFLNNESVSITPHTTLFGGTLWTDYNKGDPGIMENARGCMNDHHLVAYNGVKENGVIRKFLPADALDAHHGTLSKLRDTLRTPDQDFLVMTHHTPSWKSVHPKYGTDPLNYAFSTELTEFILEHPQIKYWVHGHTHDSFKYAIGEEGSCQVFCNPRGYVRRTGHPENAFFDPNFLFEVR